VRPAFDPRAAIAAALLLGSCSEPLEAQNAASGAELPHSPDFEVGVQTHFGQNWQAGRLELAASLPAGHLRDGLSWAGAEREPGWIAFPADRLDIFRRACAGGMRLTMTAVPRNPLYEQNNIVATADGRAAFLAYLEALLDALPGCIEAVEIGNEINQSGTLPTDGASGPEAYVQLMRAIYAPLKRKAPGVAILGGSTNAIGTGFLDRLFALGLLDHVDAIAVHPYRDHGENVGWELRHLAEVMARHGRIVPVWATEFGDEFDSAGLAAPALVKMVALLGAAGVERAHWYALSDQQWFRNMGLFDAAGRQKPAASAFAFVQRELLSRGRPRAVSDSALLQLYAFGADRWVAWGAPRDASPGPGGAAFTATGERIEGAVRLGTEPVVFTGQRPSFGPTAVLADSLLEFAVAPWSYHVRPAGGGEKPLGPLDEQFATRFGERYSRPLFASDAGGAVAGTRAQPMALVVRFTAPAAMRGLLQVCLAPNAEGDGLVVRVERNGAEVTGGDVGAPDRLATGVLDLAAAERLDVVLAPAGDSRRNNTFRYRIRLLAPEAAGLPCPADAAGWSDT
jgi:hypothetical protein